MPDSTGVVTSEPLLNAKCFSVRTNKKLKILSREFKDCFNVVLIFYDNGRMALANYTLNKLIEKSSNNEANIVNGQVHITCNMTIDQVYDIFKQKFGVEIKIMDHKMKLSIPGHLTLSEVSLN